jgi:curli biogenesis system outer membrane secretion channel CsgG
MATSTIPALKAALVARLQADGGLTGVQVSYGLPAAEEPAREAVVVGNTRPDDPAGGRGGQTSAAMGLQRREERYVLQVDVRVVRPETQQTVTARAFAIAAEVEDSVRTWGAASPAFGGAVRWALVTALWHEEAAGASARETVVHIDVACSERI